LKLPKDYLLSDLLSHNVRGNMTLSYGVGETVWMHPPVHRILGWSSKPSNFNLERNVWRLNQISQIINNEIFIKGEPAISDLSTLTRFPNLLFANLINLNGFKIGVIADFVFDLKTGKIKYYLISRSNPKIPGSSRWQLNIQSIVDQQPGLVFCKEESLNDFTLLKSSLKNEVFKKGKVLIDRFDNIKNVASNKLENWLEDENDLNDDEQISVKDIPNKSIYNKVKNSNSDSIKFKSSNKNREDDPWI
tara:strand:+ start:353 stop:1096 length:744 start_codon:yes stop_codon:yes gene_type:complete